MIRKLISRVFGGKKAAASHHEPAVIPVSSHGITRDRISSGSRRVCETLQGHGFKAYVVGGAVRDLLIGAEPKDFDVATDATPEEVRRAFRRSRIIGRRFQIVHVNMGVETIEVTTFRGHHGEQGGNKAQTDDQGRVLRDNVWGPQEEDAVRRDFTINAMYYDPASQLVLDYHGGMADIRSKTLRIIGVPEARYREDPVRLLSLGQPRRAIDGRVTDAMPEYDDCLALAERHDVPIRGVWDEARRLGDAFAGRRTAADAYQAQVAGEYAGFLDQVPGA